MSIFNDKALKSVAEAASKIMAQEASHPKTDKEKDLAAMGHPKDKITHKDVLIGRGVLKKEEAELSPKQKAIAKIAEPKHKIDGGDLAKLRAGHKPVKEEKESCEDEAEEVVDKHEKKMHGKKGEVSKHEKEMHREETEQLDEYQSKDGVYKHKGTYGGAKGAEYGDTDWDKENKDAKKMTKPKASRKLGARQNYTRSTRVNESFTNMIASYQEKGLKALAEMKKMNEEPDNEQFTKEVEDQKKSMKGEKKQPSVAAPATQGVKIMPEETEELDEGIHKEIAKYAMDNYSSYSKKPGRYEIHKAHGYIKNPTGKKIDYDKVQQHVDSMHKQRFGKNMKEESELDEAEKMKGEDPCWKNYEMIGTKNKNGKKVPNCVPKNEEYEVIDANDVNGVTIDNIEERTLTEPEAKKKEEVVKSMKKKLPSFKERYGDRAKEVMYATATQTAKEKA